MMFGAPIPILAIDTRREFKPCNRKRKAAMLGKRQRSLKQRANRRKVKR